MADNRYLDPMGDIIAIAREFISPAGASVTVRKYVRSYRAWLAQQGFVESDIAVAFRRLHGQLSDALQSDQPDNNDFTKFVFREAIDELKVG